MTAIETLKQWFSNLKKPTQEQFWAWLDSFWHKSEKIPMASVEGLDKLVEGTASAEQLSNHLNDTQAHKVLFDKKVDKVEGKELSSNDFTNEYKEKLEGLHQVDISGLLPKGDYTGTAQDLKKQIDDKANKNHKHSWGDIEGKPNFSESIISKKFIKEGSSDEYLLTGGGGQISKADLVSSGMVISGRNYLLNSNRFISSGILVEGFALSEEFKENLLDKKLVTVSCYIEYNNLTAITPKGRLGCELVISFSDNTVLYLGAWKPVTTSDIGKSFSGRLSNVYSIPTDKQITRINFSGLHIQCQATSFKIGQPKVETGNKATDWTPAPEDFDFYKEQVDFSELKTFKNRPAGSWGIRLGGGGGIYVNFPANSSASSLEFFKPNWYPATRIGVRNSVDANRFNEDNGEFRDLAWYNDVIRAGVKCSQNTTLQKDLQNQVVFVTNDCRIELNQIQNMGSVSFRKVFDYGTVTFICTEKNIIYTGDTTFTGKKGSTAVVSICENDCYIDIRNI